MARDKTDKTDTTPAATPATLTSKGKQTVKKTTPDMETIRAVNEALRADPNAEFIFELYWRARTLLDDPDLPKAAVAFEMMQSAFSAFEGGLAHNDIADAYPVAAWRKDTVEIPRALLRVWVEGWAKYKSGNTGSTLGEAFGVEGGGQGRQPVRERMDQINRDIRLSNKVEIEYRSTQADNGNAAWERAFHAVAEDEGVSADTVKRAHKKHKEAKLHRMEYLGLLKANGGKAS
jgi:hypothetical protein